jgi:hypothetical protein
MLHAIQPSRKSSKQSSQYAPPNNG